MVLQGIGEGISKGEGHTLTSLELVIEDFLYVTFVER